LEGGGKVKKIVRVKAECLAGVLLVSNKLNYFEDLWKHNPNIELEIPFSQYIELFTQHPELIQYTSLPSRNLASMDYRVLYPYFVRDVMVAQLDEIIRAQQLNKPATTIHYVVDDAFRNIPWNSVASVQVLQERGLHLVKVEESRGRLIHDRNIQPQYKALYDYCIITLGMVATSLLYLKDYYWIIK
jgi:hypothetical protein